MKTGFVIIGVLLLTFLGAGLFLAWQSPAGLSDTHLTAKYTLQVKPQSDIWELIFNSQPEVTLSQNPTSNTGWLCFPREVPQAITASGDKIVVRLEGANGYYDEQVFYDWSSRIGLPAGQGGILGGITGTVLGGIWGGVGGYVAGTQLEENAFYGQVSFPCLSPGNYDIIVKVYDDEGKFWFSKTFESVVN